MNEQSIATLDNIIRSATEQLFAAHGCIFSPNGTASAGEAADFAATIGFTEKPARGSLTIVSSGDLLGRSFPAANVPKTPENLSDWVGELSNQLLGRIKSQLVSWGIEIQLSIPVVVSGKSLSCFGAGNALERIFTFESDGDGLKIMFSVSSADEWDLDEAKRVVVETMEEGGVELF